MAALALFFSACPGPDELCQPALNPEFTTEPQDVLALVSKPVTLTLMAARMPCVSDVPTAQLYVTGPDNLPRELDAKPTLRSRSGGIVEADIALTFPEPGSWSVRVSFDPSLGSQTRVVHVATAGNEQQPLAHFTLDGPCVGAPWPLDSHAIACERSDARIDVHFDDGGLQSFPGAQLAVVDGASAVLWSRNDSQLERRDGSLRITGTWKDASPKALAGVHDVDSAVRLAIDGGLLVVAPKQPSLERLPSLEQVVGVLDGGLLWGGCVAPQKGCPVSLLGLDGLVRWTGDGGAAFSQTIPVTDGTPSLHAFRLTTLSPDVPARPLVLLPVLVDQGPLRFEARVVSGTLVFTAWPAERLRKIGRQFVLLTSGDAGVDLFVR